MNIYQDKGFVDRNDYLICLSQEYNVPFNVVMDLASILGKSEDFNGLISVLEDIERKIT